MRSGTLWSEQKCRKNDRMRLLERVLSGQTNFLHRSVQYSAAHALCQSTDTGKPLRIVYDGKGSALLASECEHTRLSQIPLHLPCAHQHGEGTEGNYYSPVCGVMARTNLEALGVESIQGLAQASGRNHAVAAQLLLLRLERGKQVCKARHHRVALRSTAQPGSLFDPCTLGTTQAG